MEVDQIVFDQALQLSCIPCQDIQGGDLRLLWVASLGHEVDHVIGINVYYCTGIGILVLEDDLSCWIGIYGGIVKHQHRLQSFDVIGLIIVIVFIGIARKQLGREEVAMKVGFDPVVNVLAAAIATTVAGI